MTPGPEPGSQSCQHDSALWHRPESFLHVSLAGAFLVRCLLGGAAGTHAFLERSFPQAIFALPKVTRDLNAPKEL